VIKLRDNRLTRERELRGQGQIWVVRLRFLKGFLVRGVVK